MWTNARPDDSPVQVKALIKEIIHIKRLVGSVKITVTDMDNAWLEVIVLILRTTDMIR
jgi:hypothetical protein|tara:strand:- start:337 stop:510 length:174 start_codon:yes stop_codon:yes gene_type:complete